MVLWVYQTARAATIHYFSLKGIVGFLESVLKLLLLLLLFMVYVVYLFISQELTTYCQIIVLLNNGTVLEGMQQIMKQS
jgi:type III secretory pathway component EscU